MTELPSSDDRRRYFRINDEIGINYRVLDDAEAEDQGSRLKRGNQLQGVLDTHDEKIARLILRLAERDPLVAEVLEAMDRKLESLVQGLMLESRITQQLAYRIHEVSISACGMAVVFDEPLQQNSLLEMQLVLLPTERQVRCHGMVIECEMMPADQGYKVRIDFCDLSSRDQEALIQHIVQRQGRLLSNV